jgi:hypothetical protein
LKRRLAVLFATHDWGLGHATRDLVLIEALLAEGHRVTVLSHGRALTLLQRELGSRCGYVELPDIPKPLGRRPFWFYVRMSLALPLVFRTFHRERHLVQQLGEARAFDCIVSDSRFGVWAPGVPSLQLFHSLRQIIPGRPRGLERLVECAQRHLLAGADRILVPDERHGGLAGDLCHDPRCDWRGRLEYIGILSSIRRRAVDQDVDCFITVSGAEPQRSLFERLVLEQVDAVPGRVVVALGRPDAAPTVRGDGRVVVHSFLGRKAQEDVMNRAAIVVTRSGYTTLMELAELGRKALVVPTPGQSEQEYLARYHEARGHLHAVRQAELDLARDVPTATGYRGLPSMPSTETSVGRFLQVLEKATHAAPGA